MELVVAELTDLLYVSDSEGKIVGVILPIGMWREIEAERETAYLLKSDAMRQRLLEAKGRKGSFSLEEVREKLGILTGTMDDQ